MPSIRQQILTYVETQLATLLQTTGGTLESGKVLELKHKGDLLAVAAQKPALHYLLGDEDARELEIDNQGCTMAVPLTFKIDTADYLNLPATTETLVAAVQTLIETDRTFGGLLSEVLKYAGRVDFLHNPTAPDGGAILTYLAQYRRKHALPSTSY